MPGRKHRALAVLGAAIISSALIAPAAHAQSTDATSVAITGGLLELSAITVDDFDALSITGNAQTTNASMQSYTVTDLRGGLGGGWQLTAQASQFTSGANTLPAGSLQMLAPTATRNSPDPLVLPPVVTPGFHVLDSALPSTIATAAPGAALVASGTGVWTFSNAADSLSLAVPATVSPGTYTSTVTMTLSAAP